MSDEPDGKLRIVRLEPNDGETTAAEQIPERDLTEIEPLTQETDNSNQVEIPNVTPSAIGSVTKSATPRVADDVTETVTKSATPRVTDDATGSVTKSATPRVGDDDVTGSVTKSATPRVGDDDVTGTVTNSVTPKVTDDVTGSVTKSAIPRVTDDVTGSVTKSATPGVASELLEPMLQEGGRALAQEFYKQLPAAAIRHIKEMVVESNPTESPKDTNSNASPTPSTGDIARIGGQICEWNGQIWEPIPEYENLPEQWLKKPDRKAVSPKIVNRYRLSVLIAAVTLLGIGTSLWMNRPTEKGLVLQNAPDPNASASPTPAPSPTEPLPIQIDSAIAARNDALDKSLTEVSKQQQAIDNSRRDYLLDKAYAQVKKNGTPVEISLLRELNRQIATLRRVVGSGGEWTGTPAQIADARASVGDAKAVLDALQVVHSDPNFSPLRSRIAPAVLTKNLIELSETSELVRSAEYEQILRNQQRQPKEGEGETLPTNP